MATDNQAKGERMAKSGKAERAVMVTTAHKGVLFGYHASMAFEAIWKSAVALVPPRSSRAVIADKALELSGDVWDMAIEVIREEEAKSGTEG